MEAYRGRWGITPLILHIGTRLWLVVSIMP